MSGSNQVIVCSAVEGLVDEAVVRRLIREVSATPGPVHVKNGKANLQQKISSYNQAAQHGLWLVLVDLDQSHSCAPDLCRQWLPQPSVTMCLRVAVREVEAWLLADKEGFAKYFSLSSKLIPSNPETDLDPKQTIVELATRSRNRGIREDLTPRLGSGRKVGPLYIGRLIEYVNHDWSPTRAAKCSDSLRRCLDHLHKLVKSQLK